MATPETVSSSCYSVIASMELVKRPPTKTVSTVAERGHGARVAASARARATAAHAGRWRGANASQVKVATFYLPACQQRTLKEAVLILLWKLLDVNNKQPAWTH